MELDFQTVKALSSPTRLKILNEVLEREATTTSLSKDVGRTKSTVSSHLETLVEAGLLEKDEEEGRRRVVYHPTDKALHIVKGREKKVKFSLGSSAVTGVLGAIIVGSQSGFLGNTSGRVETATLDSGARATVEGAAAGGGVDASTAVLLLGVGLLSFSVLGFFYGLAMRKLSA